MKSIKTQPTSYKDFFELINKTKQQKNTINPTHTLQTSHTSHSNIKIKQTPKSNTNNNTININNNNHSNSTTSLHHAQSTCLWDRKSKQKQYGQNRIVTQHSCQKQSNYKNKSNTKNKNKDKDKNKSNNKNNIQSYNNSFQNSQNTSYSQSHNQSISHQSKAQKSTIPTSPSPSTSTSTTLSYHKFITQSTTVLSQIFKSSIPQLLSSRISYIQYLQSLKLLKMIYQNYQPYPNDTVSQLWIQCISNRNVGNFIIILCSILGLYQNKNKLTQQDKYIKNKYSSLRYTRMQLNRSNNIQGDYYNNNNKNKNKQNQCTFTPQISERSRKLATSRSKQKRQNRHALNSINTQHALTDRNIYNNNNIHQNSTIYHEQKSKASINQQYYQNLFTQNNNNIHNNNNNNNNNITIKPLKTDYTGNKRSQLLYQRAKQKSCQRRQNKSSNDIQYQKNIKQLTFKPTILKVKNKFIDKQNQKQKQKQKEKQKSKCMVKGQKNTISRMIRGRVQRQVRKIINQKGVPYNQKLVDKMRKQKYQQITTNSLLTQSYDNTTTPTSFHNPSTPLSSSTTKQSNINQPKIQPFIRHSSSSIIPQQDILIDVYLSQDHKQKLIVRKGQNLQQIATKFIQKHGISIDKKQQLIQLLEVSMKHALCPIDQLVEEEDQLASARTHYQRDNYR